MRSVSAAVFSFNLYEISDFIEARAAERLHGEVPPELVTVTAVLMLKTKSYFKIMIMLWLRGFWKPDSNSIHSQAWSLKLADQKRASKTARLECCAVLEIRRVKTEKIPLQQRMQQPNALCGNQKSLVARPTINSAGN